MGLLASISNPRDLKSLSFAELETLAEEIRQRVIQVTSANGGHIGPNLGVVELTLALHRVFETPQDAFVFDVAHQGYVHKLLTGRNDEAFDLLRQTGGYSGFLSRAESPHDAYGAGHAGTALSAALGMAVARDRAGDDSHVVAVAGDAAFTCGITLEALNNIQDATPKFIVILNDNEWSISENVGAIARYFNHLITNPVYTRIDRNVQQVLAKMPGGKPLIRLARKWKRGTKDFLVSSSFFETFGLRYLGPIDGHDLPNLERFLQFAKESPQPVLLHVQTIKGKGYEPALASPEKFHGASPFDLNTGQGKPKAPGTPPNYQDAFGQCLLRHARDNNRIVGITAAMPPGTGLVYLRENLPQQFFDVGIAEEHAVLFAAGMACKGFRPVVAIYSTFLQRAVDPIIHDVCLQRLPVVFCMDRAGLSPNDGPTHHGLFDIAYLRGIPEVVLAQPRNEDELADLLHTGLLHDGPFFIRYPRGTGTGEAIKESPARLPIGRAEVLREGDEIQIWALGPWVQTGEDLAARLAACGISVGMINARFIKPLDGDLLQRQASHTKLFITLEDHARQNGFGSALLETLSDFGLNTPVLRIGWPDRFVDHASSVQELRRANGLDDASVWSMIEQAWQQLNGNRPKSPTLLETSSQTV
jgi:1-deoxy-D-xylulose-5-phosphate synthase